MPVNTAKPSTSLFTWATNALTRVAPTAGQLLTGWTNGERPPFNVMNYLLGVMLDWAVWFEDAIDELDADKIDRDGSVTMAGVLTPDNGTRDIGLTGTPFQTVYAKNYVVKELLVMDSAARVSADMLPSADGIDLGSDSLRFDVFGQNVNAEAIITPPAQDNIAAVTTSINATGRSFIEVSAVTTATINNITGGVAGQLLVLLSLDSGITLTDAGNVGLIGGVDWTPNANDTIVLIYSATQAAWIELTRGAV